jgi:thiamine biosynthesis lipoprotein ApbE
VPWALSATLILNLESRADAARLVDRVVAEVSRLERVFSLYQRDSALSELNRTGAIAAPPAELVNLLEASRDFWETTGGAFDPTVQPLWTLYAEHFSASDADPAGPSEDAKRRALSRVGFEKLKFNRDRVVFARPGMALTLNGIAQGYITDRIVGLLREAGIANSLVSMGETRAIGGAAGRPAVAGRTHDARRCRHAGQRSESRRQGRRDLEPGRFPVRRLRPLRPHSRPAERGNAKTPSAGDRRSPDCDGCRRLLNRLQPSGHFGCPHRVRAPLGTGG